jgi:hypothetical protein
LPARPAAGRGDVTDSEAVAAALQDAQARGEAPFPWWGYDRLHGGIFDNALHQGRAQGMACGQSWIPATERATFYVDLGFSAGMHAELAQVLAMAAAPEIHLRRLSPDPRELGIRGNPLISVTLQSPATAQSVDLRFLHTGGPILCRHDTGAPGAWMALANLDAEDPREPLFHSARWAGYQRHVPGLFDDQAIAFWLLANADKD